MNSVTTAILGMSSTDKFGRELASAFNRLVGPLDGQTRLLLAAVIWAGAPRYAKTTNTKSQKHMERLSRVIKSFGAVAGFIPVPRVGSGAGLAAVLGNGLLHHAYQSKFNDLKGQIMEFAAQIDLACTRLRLQPGNVFHEYFMTATFVASV
ncbi:hypothetical protein CNMCM5623_000585 [Aspergillus felis]|uniref:Uncharacterized protein n=1 Tax=Aspergillus felis TaxID=1287682 RepID=A0A8H6R1K7_9EURO|nr:hypothetical protein CNMCM5623_000585 [Aspergillus felis]KAF7183026.1 hypothetical protein CNMCM7691_002861 [Aspergillus felis]